MIEALLVLAFGGIIPMAAVLVVRHSQAGQWRRELVVYRLRFPRDLDPAAVATLMVGLSGLVAPRWQRPFVVRAVVLEVTATPAGITHHLLVPRSLAPVVLSQLHAAMPNVATTEDPDYEPSTPTLAGELGLSSAQRPLRVDEPAALTAGLLATFQPLHPGEAMRVQWVISPVGPTATVADRPAGASTPSVLRGLLGGTPRPADREGLRALRAKYSAPMFLVSLRLGVTASTPERSRSLLRRLTATFHAASAPGAHFFRRRLPAALSRTHLTRRHFPLLPSGCVLNATELAALTGLPVVGVQVAGLNLDGTRQLPPVAAIPRVGRIVAHSTFPGLERPLALSPTDSLKHLHVIGPTGVGKSTLLLGLITQDIAAGRGVVVIEPKGDLIADVLDRVPPERTGDVIVLDPLDDAPVGLNLLAEAEQAPELVVDQIVGVFHQLYRAFWGPRTDDVLRSALLTLAREPGMTLCEVPLLLTDEAFRRRLVGRLDDPVALEPFWGWYNAQSGAERAQVIAPVMNKLRSLLLRRRLRNVVGQSRPSFDMDRAIAEQRIVLAPLSKGLLGEEASSLLGSLLVARLWWAVMRRSGLPSDLRPPVFAYIDEAQDYLNLPTSIGDVLAQARGLGLGLTLAHQHLGQLPPALREAVLANARSRVIFQTSATDARVLARELAPHLEPSDLQGLGAYEVVVSLAVGASVAPPATGTTLPPAPVTGQAAVARAVSRERYGRPRAEVEAALRTRHRQPVGDGSIGRRGGSS